MSEGTISRLRENDPTLTTVLIDHGRGISIHQFGSSVQENSRITDLCISDFHIDMVAANELSAALGRMPFLEEVHMMRCPLESIEVAATLASSLAGRFALQRLGFLGCNIDDGCVQAISTSFSAHQSLQTLYLQHNPIGNVGAISIGSLIALNGSLTTVTLIGSNFGADGFEAIVRGIVQNRTLERLNLSDNAANFPSFQNTFKRALYNNDSIDAVLTGSNHTLRHLRPAGDADLRSLLGMNCDGPEEARRRKLTWFLETNPGPLLSVGVTDTLLPSAIEKLGRVGVLNAMYLSLRDIPGIFEKG